MATSSHKYVTVAVSQTAAILGPTGAAGDRIFKLIVSVTAAATSTMALLDNATSIPILAATTALGVYTLDFGEKGIVSTSGAWKVTTGAGVSVIAVGEFT